MRSSRVWVFSGRNDTVVQTQVVRAAARFYSSFIDDDSQIAEVYDIEGEHSQITNFYGSTCTKLGEPFINNCKYDAAGAILQHIYKNSLTKPANHDSKGQIYSFDQA